MFIAGNILQKQKGEKRYNITSICSKVWCVSLLTNATLTWLWFSTLCVCKDPHASKYVWRLLHVPLGITLPEEMREHGSKTTKAKMQQNEVPWCLHQLMGRVLLSSVSKLRLSKQYKVTGYSMGTILQATGRLHLPGRNASVGTTSMRRNSYKNRPGESTSAA